MATIQADMHRLTALLLQLQKATATAVQAQRFSVFVGVLPHNTAKGEGKGYSPWTRTNSTPSPTSRRTLSNSDDGMKPCMDPRMMDPRLDSTLDTMLDTILGRIRDMLHRTWQEREDNPTEYPQRLDHIDLHFSNGARKLFFDLCFCQ